MPVSDPRPLKKPAAREAKPGPLGVAGEGGGAWAGGVAEGGGGAAAGGGGGGAALRPPRGSGISGSCALRSEQSQVLDQPLGEGVRLGIALEVADGVGAADRVGLAEQVVAEADLGVRVGAADLGQRRTRPDAHLVGRDAEQGADVLVALPSLEQQLKHRALFIRDRHERGSLGQRGNA